MPVTMVTWKVLYFSIPRHTGMRAHADPRLCEGLLCISDAFMQEDCCMSQVAAGKCDINAFHTITRTHRYTQTHHHRPAGAQATGARCQSLINKWTANTPQHGPWHQPHSLTWEKKTLTHTVPWRHTCQSNGDTGKCSLYLVPFDEVASIPQCERNGGRLEFQCVDPRLSTGHRFTHTGTHTHTSARYQTLRCCVSVRSGLKLLRSHTEMFSRSSILSLPGSLQTLLSFLFTLKNSLSLFSYPSFLPSWFYSSSLLFCRCCIFQSQTETDAFVGDRICVWVRACMCVCVCACVHCLHKLTHLRHAHNRSFPQMGEG